MEKNKTVVQEIEFDIPEIPEFTDEELEDFYYSLIQGVSGG